jgi:hypothetical protein
MQLDLMETFDPSSRSSLQHRNYWRCIIPLTSIELTTPTSDLDAFAQVQQILRSLAADLDIALSELKLTTRDLSVELTRIFFIALRELISNCVVHSRSPELLVAVAIQRNTDRGQPIRHVAWTHQGQDRFDLLVMDLGLGILPTVLATLGQRPVAASYRDMTTPIDSLRLPKVQEESLLSNIFRGNLVVRKGRRSEGLYELGRALSWFDGVLNFFSGRTELQLHSFHSDDLTPDLCTR